MKAFFALVISIGLAGCLQAQTPASPEHIRTLLSATGAANTGLQMVDLMISSYRKELPSVPAEFWDEFRKELNPDDLIELIVPIYAKYFSDEEILQLTQFYQTPLGKKFVGALPMITKDSYSAGQEWGKKVGEKVVARLKEKGLLEKN